MRSPVEIFVRLLDEGVEVWRPVSALKYDDDTFEILGMVPEWESWEFGPGARVRCVEKIFSGERKGLVAREIVKG